jgi:hypothetical protein
MIRRTVHVLGVHIDSVADAYSARIHRPKIACVFAFPIICVAPHFRQSAYSVHGIGVSVSMGNSPER